MTKDKALQLPASRELDAIIAQKVMGEPEMTLQVGTRCPKCGGETRFCGLRSRCLGDCNEWIDSPYLCYSDEIEAAWQVVEKLRSEGYSTHIGTQNNGHVWTMQVSKRSLETCHEGYGDTVELCIVHAALKALWKD